MINCKLYKKYKKYKIKKKYGICCIKEYLAGEDRNLVRCNSNLREQCFNAYIYEKEKIGGGN